jgi:hypothetical protein
VPHFNSINLQRCPGLAVNVVLSPQPQRRKRDRSIVAFGLAGVTTLSWTYLIYLDWGMRHMDVGMEMVIMPAMLHWTAWDLVLVFKPAVFLLLRQCGG